MASIIKTSINLDQIDKSKIYVGKKGKYLPVTITLTMSSTTSATMALLLLSKLKKSVKLNHLKLI
jgi:hypothetical protein